MWVAVPKPRKAWEYLQAGLLWYGIPGETTMFHYDEDTASAWREAGFRYWCATLRDAPDKDDPQRCSGFLPNHIFLED